MLKLEQFKKMFFKKCFSKCSLITIQQQKFSRIRECFGLKKKIKIRITKINRDKSGSNLTVTDIIKLNRSKNKCKIFNNKHKLRFFTKSIQ